MKYRPGFLSSVLVFVIAILSLLVPAPVHAGAGATVAPDAGTAGTSVLVEGENFTGTLAVIHWDGQVVAEDVPISEEGNISFDLVVPNASGDEHTILITDDTNWSGSTATAVFTVLPDIELFPRWGEESTLITVTGKGFGSNETNITVTWDDSMYPISPIKADKYGTWYGMLTVPGAAMGEHLIGAYGSTTPADEVDRVTLIVTPWLIVEPESGTVGTKVTVTGWGFRLNELGITITWDESPVKTDIRPLSDGSIKETFTTPASARGYHKINIFGKLYTNKGDLPEIEFEVSPSMQITPVSGKRGTKVTVSGTGFARGEKAAIQFDSKVIDTATADAEGSFQSVITVPRSELMEHEISVSGDEGSFARVDFLTEKSTSPAPVLEFPPGDAVYDIFGSLVDVFFHGFTYIFGKNVRPPALVFEWSDVEAGEELRYKIQIATDMSFTAPVLEKTVSGGSEYPLSGTDELKQGTYMWRVRMMDDEGDEGPWSEISQFEIEVMPPKVLIFTCVVLALLLALLVLIGIMVWNRLSRIR
jgi:hypothetical protein